MELYNKEQVIEISTRYAYLKRGAEIVQHSSIPMSIRKAYAEDLRDCGIPDYKKCVPSEIREIFDQSIDFSKLEKEIEEKIKQLE